MTSLFLIIVWTAHLTVAVVPYYTGKDPGICRRVRQETVAAVQLARGQMVEGKVLTITDCFEIPVEHTPELPQETPA